MIALFGRKQVRSLLFYVGPWLFALFLTAGSFKADPRLAVIQEHVDLTLLFLILSFSAFLSEKLVSRYKIPVSRVSLLISGAFVGLLAVMWGGLLISRSWGYGLEKTIRFSVLTGWAFFGAGFFIGDDKKLANLSWALSMISLVFSVASLLKYVLARGEVYFVSVFGSNYIALGRIAGLGLLINVCFLLPIYRRPMTRLLLWAGVLLDIWALLISGARGPVVATVLSLLLLLLLNVKGLLPSRTEHIAFRSGLAALLVLIGMAVAGRDLFSTLWTRSAIALSTQKVDEGYTSRGEGYASRGGKSISRRLTLYHAALSIWGSSPVLGVGPGGFGVHFRGRDARLYPHNIVLELGSETGGFGVSLFLVVVGVPMIRALARMRRARGVSKTVLCFLITASSFLLLNAMMSGDVNDNRMLFAFIPLLSSITERLWEQPNG